MNARGEGKTKNFARIELYSKTECAQTKSGMCRVRACFNRNKCFKEVATVHIGLESRWKRLHYAPFDSNPTPPRPQQVFITSKTG